ncbi:hypothetical protein FOZ63_023997, partial [Perkinsus olseni]
YEHAKFLTLLWGRGLFYLFQGSLALVQFTLLYAIVGVYMVVMGVLCIAMWKGALFQWPHRTGKFNTAICRAAYPTTLPPDSTVSDHELQTYYIHASLWSHQCDRGL